MLGRSALPVGLLLLGWLCPSVLADEPVPAKASSLHSQIDELIRSTQVGPVAGQADDATFLRRITLDLIGRIPTHEQVDAFLADEAPEKRTMLIDQLLADPEYPQHMAVVFDLMLMERRGGKHVKTDAFRAYLEQAFVENQSYREIVREVLSADGTAENNRPAAAFYLEREVEPHLLTRDVGRVFFGVDLQCAQCHNHPLIDDYYQPDYYGLQAFFVRSSLFQADKKKPALIAEQATGEADFKSVFTAREGMIGPLVPGGVELVSTTLKPMDQYQVAPATNVRPIPSQSRREQLAAAVVDAPSPAFQRNIVNRLWAHMMGRGLVHPVDLHHSANPPTHPEVLDLLANRFAESEYDVKWLLRELALTSTYQRSFQLPDLQPSLDEARTRVIAAEATAAEASTRASAADTEAESLLEKLDAAVAEAKPVRDAEAAANKQVSDALKVRNDAQTKVTARQQDIAQRKNQAALLQQSVESTKKASVSLKDDQDLAAALATIEKRLASYQDQLKQQQESLKPEQAALAAAEETLTAKSSAADQAIAARVPVEEKVRTLRAEFFAARALSKELRLQANVARHEVDYLGTLIAYDNTQKQIATLAATLAQHKQEIDTNAKAIAKAESRLTTKTSVAQTAQARVAAQRKSLSMAATSLDAVRKTQSQLSESIASAESALATLSDDQPVSEAIALLKTSLSGVDDEAKQSQAAVDEEQAAIEILQVALATAIAERTQVQEMLRKLQEQQGILTIRATGDQQALVAAQAELAATTDTLIDQSSERGNVMGLTALTPEQLALSTLIATGQYERQRIAARAKIEKAATAATLPEGAATDPNAISKQNNEIAKVFAESLRGTIATFVKLYGAGPGQPQQEFFATAEQSLFAANGNEVRAWLQPAGGNLTQRLIDLESADQLAQELYASVLSRRPTSVEVEDVTSYLATRPDERHVAIQELAWGLLTSVEFRFRH